MSFGAPPAGIDLSENIKSRVIGTDVALLIVATIAVGLRVISRFVSKAPFWWDDWVLGVSLVMTKSDLERPTRQKLTPNPGFCIR